MKPGSHGGEDLSAGGTAEVSKIAADLKSALRGAPAARVVVLCIGNPMRGDDAFGKAVADEIRGGLASPVLYGGQAPENELGRIASLSPEAVVLVDAVDLGAPAGTLRVAEPEGLRMAGFDTHTASLSLAADFLAEACGARAVILGAQPAHLDLDKAMSEEMRLASRRAAEALRRVLGKGG